MAGCVIIIGMDFHLLLGACRLHGFVVLLFNLIYNTAIGTAGCRALMHYAACSEDADG